MSGNEREPSMPETHLEWAKFYLGRGWSIIPIKPGTKVSKGLWKKYQTARMTEVDAAAIWGVPNPPDIALVMGESSGGLVCPLEVDHRQTADSLATRLQGRTLLQRSQHGGLHVFVQCDKEVKTRKHWDDLPVHVDFRGWRTFVLAQPSQGYQWVNLGDQTPASLTDPVAWASGELKAMGLEPGDNKPVPLYEAADTEIKSKRNMVLTSIAGNMLRANIRPEWVRDAVRGINATSCKPPLKETELRATLDSLGRRMVPDPIAVDNIYKAWGGESVDTEEPPVRFLVADFLPAEMISFLYGSRATGKSYVAMLLAICIAEGLPFLDLVTEQASVMWLDWELEPAMWKRRIRRLSRGLDLETTPRQLLYMRPEIPLKQAAEFIRQDIHSSGVQLGIIDSLGMALAGYDMEKSGDVVNALLLLRSFGIPFLLIDHTSRVYQGESEARKGIFGSIYKENIARTIWQSLKVGRGGEDYFDMSLSSRKNSFDIAPEPIQVHIQMGEQVVTVLRSKSNQTDFLEVLKNHGGESTARAVAGAMGCHERTVHRIADALAKLGTILVDDSAQQKRFMLPQED